MADPLVIETVDLKKSYGDVEAVSGLTLAVPRGSIWGFLGKNGAGKTTTIKMLLGMTRPTSGVARVFGMAADDRDSSVAIRRHTGFVSDDKALYDGMTVEQMTRFTAAFYPEWRRDLEERYIHRFELPSHRAVKTLSRGMRTKLAMVLALCRSAELLVLDEPTASLDPAAAEDVLQTIVAHVASEGTTVFFSSHQLAEVEQVADSITIIDRGRGVLSGSLDDIRARYCRVQIVFNGTTPDAVGLPGVVRTRREGRVLTVVSSAGADRVLAAARAFNPLSTDVFPVSLKEIFLETVAEED